MKFITFTINLTETTIQINDDKTIYPLNIEFNNNEIIVCQQEINENTITGFVEELFKEPTQYNKYTINYQNKEYQVLPETLLVLIINEFKKDVDKKGIINRFLFKTTNTNKDVLQRIKSSLINIGIPNSFTEIKHKHKQRKSFYIDEEYIVYEILENQKKYKQFCFEIVFDIL